MTVSTTVTAQTGGFMKIKLTGAVSAANAGLGQVANPEGVNLAITRAFIYARTGSTGAANLDIGIGASGAKASDVCSAMDMIEATIGGDVTYLPAAQAAETDSPTAIWTPTTYLTFTGSADSTGLDADVYVEYIRLA